MADSNEIRKPAVAGAFYPDNPVALTKMMAEFFARAEKKAFAGRPIAVVAPHAGYIYSGKTAAFAYKQLEGENYDTVVVIAPSHTIFFQGASVYNGAVYKTPLGDIEIDDELSKKVGSINPSVYLSNKGHTGGSIRGEHSLEVQLPFLQQVLGKFRLVAIIMGEQEESVCRALGEVLASALDDKNALIVASSDLSHFYNANKARELDGNIQKAVERFNPEHLLNTLSSGKGEACGGGPIASAMIAAKRLGGEQVIITDYSTSGETTGDFSEVVGYLSAVIVSSKAVPKAKPIIGEKAARESQRLTDDDKKFLLNLARNTIRAKLHGEKISDEIPGSKILKELRGAFVTIKIHGMLRGCIGLIRAARPLYEAVKEMAEAAAFDDPRFQPLTAVEYDSIDLEISVLSPLIRVNDISVIKVGRDGLMIRFDLHSGLLLPQVATEQRWDEITFLEQTCLKAGLPKNSYKEKSAEIYRFTADVFSEKDFE